MSESEQNLPSVGDVPNPSEGFGIVRNDSEHFGTVPKSAEDFRTVRNASERTENHTLTVREVARVFENAGVARTERSIINWCQPNPQGVARLDAYYDLEERRWFITQESVRRVITEEMARSAKHGELGPKAAERVVEPGAGSQEPNGGGATSDSEPPSERLKQLETEVMDLRILNSGKDFFIEQLRNERGEFIQQLVEGSRRIGELETKLRQLSAPQENSDGNHGSGPEASV